MQTFSTHSSVSHPGVRSSPTPRPTHHSWYQVSVLSLGLLLYVNVSFNYFLVYICTLVGFFSLHTHIYIHISPPFPMTVRLETHHGLRTLCKSTLRMQNNFFICAHYYRAAIRRTRSCNVISIYYQFGKSLMIICSIPRLLVWRLIRLRADIRVCVSCFFVRCLWLNVETHDAVDI